MFTQACQPCAKRKVRCDRKQPCSNCKRRRQDVCTYLETGAIEEIRRLESLVRQLGGDPGQKNKTQTISGSAAESASPTPAPLSQVKTGVLRNNSAAIVLDEDESVYVEFSEFSGWHNGKAIASLQRPEKYLRMDSRNANALDLVLPYNPAQALWTKHPAPHDAKLLWRAFYRNVDPIFKCSFFSELESYRMLPMTQDVTNPEHSFIFALYLLTIASLSEEDCRRDFSRSREDLLSEYRLLCEQALVLSDFIGSTEIVVLQALTMYMIAGFYLLSTKSLWSLQGLVLRNAERMGLHRDGTHIRLSPFETERRRRIWWQLQYLDVGFAVWSGSAAITVLAEWDTKLPLNIEDGDIGPDSREFPKERRGVTSMSETLSKYYILRELRQFRHPDGRRLDFGWMTNTDLSFSAKQALIDRLEDSINTKFLQFCDPIKPRDLLLQLHLRNIICVFRRLILHPLSNDGTVDTRDELLDASIQLMAYDVAIRTNKDLEYAKWSLNALFQWGAFIHIISEATQQRDESKAVSMWKLILDVYSCTRSLIELDADPRNLHAAEILVPAWKLQMMQMEANHPQVQDISDLVAMLENELAKVRSGNELSNEQTPSDMIQDTPVPTASASSHIKDSTNHVEAVFTFDEIDWAFWEGVDLPDMDFTGL